MKRFNTVITILFALIFNLNAQTGKQSTINWPVLSKSPWPMTFGNSQANGRTTVIGPKTNNVKWQINKQFGVSGCPIISSSNNLYFGSDWNTYFYSMKTDTTVNWSYKGNIVNYVAGGMIIDLDENIYVGSNDSYFNKFDKNGNLKWKYKTGGPIRGGLINIGLDSVLYFTSADSNFYALTNDGKLKWKLRIGSGFYFSSPTLAPDYKTIYICGQDSNLYALNLDGSVKWKYSCKAPYSVPLIDVQGNIYVKQFGLTYPFEYVSLNQDGTKRWGYGFNDTNIAVESSACMDLKGNLFIADMAKLYSLDYNGKLRWSKYISPAPSGIYCPLTCDAEGKVYFGCTRGTAYYCYNNDGTLAWTLPLDGHNVDWAPAFGPDGTLYIGVHKGPNKVSMYAIKDNTSDVKSETAAPVTFELKQNYPNPFNPETTISYSIAENSFVRLNIFDLLGREVSTLVDREQFSGEHNIQFDGSSLPSGVYIYTIQAGSFRDSKKLLLLK